MNQYITDIKKQLCGCSDWQETRSHYPLNDPRRLCKHIINKLNIENLPDELKYFKELLKCYNIFWQKWIFTSYKLI